MVRIDTFKLDILRLSVAIEKGKTAKPKEVLVNSNTWAVYNRICDSRRSERTVVYQSPSYTITAAWYDSSIDGEYTKQFYFYVSGTDGKEILTLPYRPRDQLKQLWLIGLIGQIVLALQGGTFSLPANIILQQSIYSRNKLQKSIGEIVAIDSMDKLLTLLPNRSARHNLEKVIDAISRRPARRRYGGIKHLY